MSDIPAGRICKGCGQWNPAGRICKGCGQWKSFSEFHKDKYGQYGYYSRCKDCKRQSDYQRQPKLPSTLDRRALQAQGLKRCRRCKEAKKPEEFHKQTRGLFGRTSICKECGAIEHNEWKENNPDYYRQYYIDNREAYTARTKARPKEYQRQYYAKNRDEINAYQRQWRIDNPEKSVEHSRKWREKNPEYFKKLNKKRRRDPEFIKKQQKRGRQYYQANKAKRQTEEYRERRRKRRRKYRVRETEYARRRRAQIYGAARNFSHDDWLQILEDQKHKCKYCGKPFSDDLPPTVDHVWPLAKGGNHTAINIVAACKPCNARKHKKIPKQLNLL